MNRRLNSSQKELSMRNAATVNETLSEHLYKECDHKLLKRLKRIKTKYFWFPRPSQKIDLLHFQIHIPQIQILMLWQYKQLYGICGLKFKIYRSPMLADLKFMKKIAYVSPWEISNQIFLIKKTDDKGQTFETIVSSK